WLRVEICPQYRQIESKQERRTGIFLVRLKGELPVIAIYIKLLSLIVCVVRGRIFLHGRFLSLNRLGFGYVGLASVNALVGPRRLGGASYHSICELFSGISEDLKLRHYPSSLCLCASVVNELFVKTTTETQRHRGWTEKSDFSCKPGLRRIMATSIDEAKLKDMLKSAVAEVFEERRDFVKEIVEEAMEDIALMRAIDEGVR